jgi:hypothetical protein
MAIEQPIPENFRNTEDYNRARAAWNKDRDADAASGFLGGGFAAVKSDDNPQSGTNSTAASSIGGNAGSATLIPTNISGQKSGNELIDEQFPGVRKENPLGNYSSSTYAITLYMCTAEFLNKFAVADPPGKLPDSSDGIFVVAQSGGINNAFDNRLLTKTRRLGSISNREEGLDYYIDDLNITIQLPQGATNLATTAGKIDFKIIEPIGFSFLQDLAIASTRINGLSPLVKSAQSQPSSMQQNYILGIRFYGYDVNGEVVNPGTNPKLGSINTEKTDKNSISERFIPMLITEMKFKLDDKATVYSFEGQYQPIQVAFGEKLNATNSNTRIQGKTVDGVLTGPDGLLTQLNNKAQNLVDNGTAKIPTKYEIEWIGGDDNPIAKSLLVDDKYVLKALTEMYNAPSTEKSNVSGTARAITYDPTSRISQFAPGTAITEIIDNVIVKSSFISDALNGVGTGETESQINPSANLKELKWYYINPIAKIVGRDDNLNDWSYNITYQIGVYEIPYIRTQYKNATSIYPGPYKVYNYIYTGENSEVIEFEQTYDQLYGVYKATTQISTENVAVDNLYRKIGSVPLTPSPSSNSNSVGGKQNGGSILNENVRAQLYSSGDQATAKLKILGDPDWIMTIIGVDQQISSLYSGTSNSNELLREGSRSLDLVKNITRQRYGSDYSINPYGGQVFIQIIFGIATDYQDNGLLDVGNDIMFYEDTKVSEANIQGFVYQVAHVYNSFSRGQFTQTFDLVYVPSNLLITNSSLAPSESRDNNSATPQDNDTRNSSIFIDPKQRPNVPDSRNSSIFIDNTQRQVNQRFADDDRAGHSSIFVNPTPSQSRSSEDRTTR